MRIEKNRNAILHVFCRTRQRGMNVIPQLFQQGCNVDRSRNCSAPLTAYYAQKENDNGTEAFT